jgi:muconolactone delta-isomerase
MMLFMYIHTHSVDKCMVDQPQELAKMSSQMREEAQKANIKVTTYSAPHEHTIYSIIDANDIATLEKILTPMTKWGDADLIPIISMEQIVPVPSQ